MTRGRLSRGAIFIIVSLITLLLLLGSVILQRIVFKAEQTFSSLYLQSDSSQPVVGQEAVVSLVTDLASPSLVSGVQAEISYNSEDLEFMGAQPSINYQTISLIKTDGKVDWAVMKSDTEPLPIFSQGKTSFGSLIFMTKKIGSNTINLEQKQTRLSIIDQVGGALPYNGADTVQGVAISVRSSETNDIIAPQASPTIQVGSEDLNAQSNLLSSQRIISQETVSFSTSALILVHLQNADKIKVDFGPTPTLDNNAQTTLSDTNQIIRLSALESGKRYYYRVSVIDSQNSSNIVSRLRSFETTAVGGSVASAEKSRLIVFPNQFSDNANIFISLHDQNDDQVVDAEPSLSIIDGEASISTISNNEGLYQARIQSTKQAEQVIKIRLKVGDETIAQQTVLSNPQLNNQPPIETHLVFNLTWGTKTLIALIGLMLILTVFGLLFIKLARSR